MMRTMRTLPKLYHVPKVRFCESGVASSSKSSSYTSYRYGSKPGTKLRQTTEIVIRKNSSISSKNLFTRENWGIQVKARNIRWKIDKPIVKSSCTATFSPEVSTKAKRSLLSKNQSW